MIDLTNTSIAIILLGGLGGGLIFGSGLALISLHRRGFLND